MTTTTDSTLTPMPGIIIVGFDGSASARGALQQGIDLAELLHTELRIIATWQYPISYLLGLPLAHGSQDIEITLKLEDAVHDAFPGDLPEWVSAEVIEGGAAKILIEESRGAELLVVGSRGLGAVASRLLGSVSIACMTYAHCPVLISRNTLQVLAESPSVSNSATVPA